MSTLITYKAIDGGDVQEVSPDPVRRVDWR